MSHEMSTDPNLGLSNRHSLWMVQSAGCRAAPPSSSGGERLGFSFLLSALSLATLIGIHPCFHHRDIGILIFLSLYNKDPRRAHPNLTERERASLAHVDPDVNLGEEEFYFPHRGECPTMDEHKQAQPGSGYPIKLPLGLQKLRSHDDPEIIRAYADILGSLMQPTYRPPVDYLKMHEFTSSIAINMLTLNHGKLTRNPKLDNREVYNMPMKDRPIVKMMMQNSARVLCLNEADAFFSPNDEKSRELIKQSSSRPIACFVRGGPSARVELLARHISTKSQNWGTTFGMFRCFFGTEGSCTDPEYEIPTSDCLATTGPSMFTESKKYIGLSKDMAGTRRSSFSISSRVMSFVA